MINIMKLFSVCRNDFGEVFNQDKMVFVSPLHTTIAVSIRLCRVGIHCNVIRTGSIVLLYRRQHSLNIKMENARLREHASDVFNMGVKAVFPQAMMLNALKLDGNVLTVADRRYIINRNIHVVAFGKAVIGMVRTAEDILKDHIVGGIASVPRGMQDTLKSLGKW